MLGVLKFFGILIVSYILASVLFVVVGLVYTFILALRNPDADPRLIALMGSNIPYGGLLLLILMIVSMIAIYKVWGVIQERREQRGYETRRLRRASSC